MSFYSLTQLWFENFQSKILGKKNWLNGKSDAMWLFKRKTKQQQKKTLC